MTFEGPGSGETTSQRIMKELQSVHRGLTELEKEQSDLHIEIDAKQKRIVQLQEYLQQYDRIAEAQRAAGTLKDDLANAFARTISDIDESLAKLTEDETGLLTLKCAFENGVAILKQLSEELLRVFPRDVEH